MSWRVFVDFDGTITLDDVTNSILDRFASPSWRSIEAEWQCGAIGSRECMERQVRLVRATRDELQGLIAQQAVDRDFVGFVHDCRASGIPVAVVSDGLDLVVDTILQRIGLPEVPSFANRLVQVDQRRWQLLFPYGRPRCRSQSGNCKCAAQERGSTSGNWRSVTILIGDGRSDLCVASEADIVFAKKDLLRLCRQDAIACIPFENFAQVRSVFADVVTSSARQELLAGVEEMTDA